MVMRVAFLGDAPVVGDRQRRATLVVVRGAVPDNLAPRHPLLAESIPG